MPSSTDQEDSSTGPLSGFAHFLRLLFTFDFAHRVVFLLTDKGVETRYEAIPGMNHFTICDPMADPDSAMTKRMVELAKLT